MALQRLFIVMMAIALWTATEAIASKFDNPFEKNISVDIGRDSGWVISDGSATRSGSDADNFYHLNYDRKQLRLRITEGADDSVDSARQYQQFAIEEVQVDGKRLPVFQWCLNNQPRHSRFLQQGLSISNDVRINQGESGTFYMRLNVATLKLLEQGKTLSFTIRPFRTAIDVNFDISDFSTMSAQLAVPAIAKAVEPAKAKAAAPVKTVEKCRAEPPAGIVEVKTIEYNCGDAVAKKMAESSIAELVKKERERKEKAAAERERKRLAVEAARKKELEAKKAAEAALAAEQAAIAASLAKQEAINNEIANKMIAVCKKKWAAGEHRCYCEKYLEHAPAGIKSDPSCGS